MLDDYLASLSSRCVCGFEVRAQGCRCPGAEWTVFLRALRTVAFEHDGRVEWTYVRPLIRDRIEHKHIGQFTKDAKRLGYLTEIDIVRSKDVRGKNAGRPEPLYLWKEAA